MIIGFYSSTPQCGKSTAAQFMEQNGYKVLPFAEPLKKLVYHFLIICGYSIKEAGYYLTHKEEPLKLIPGAPTTRRLLRTLGTEWGRDLIHPDIWVDAWKRRAMDYSNIVVDDVRFESEYKAIKQAGGVIWKIERKNAYDGELSQSDHRLDDFAFDAVIKNERMGDFICKIKSMI